MARKWDGAEMGCAQLIFRLSLEVKKLDPGEELEVIARDPGAATDLPAWCRMTGHTLVSADPPRFVIARKSAP